jgi:hypothetical protein
MGVTGQVRMTRTWIPGAARQEAGDNGYHLPV